MARRLEVDQDEGHIQGLDRGQGLDQGPVIVDVLLAEADPGAEAGTTSDEIDRKRTRVVRRRTRTGRKRAEMAVPSGETDHVPLSKTTATNGVARACRERKVVVAVESRAAVVTELPTERASARSLVPKLVYTNVVVSC